jgi:hypothetical protein
MSQESRMKNKIITDVKQALRDFVGRDFLNS